jgi:branched-chain amino acid transport system permease protein
VAAVLIGELNAFGVLVLPQATIVLAFVVMAVVLIIRPYGLFGKAEAAAHAAGQVEAPIRPASPLMKGIALATLALLLALPLLFDSFAVVLATDILIFALFAASLHFIMGNGGMVSFGHAAYFGLGCYGAAFMVKYLGGSMEMAFDRRPAFRWSRCVDLRLVLCAPVGRLHGHADAGRCADRLVHRFPVAGVDRWRRWPSGRLAV